MKQISEKIKFNEMERSKCCCLSSEFSKNSKLLAQFLTPPVVESGITRHFLMLTFNIYHFK